MKVFVYGTLRTGERLHPVLHEDHAGRPRTSTLVERATITGYTMHHVSHDPKTSPYPVALQEPGGTIEGEVWEVDAGTLAELDQIELGAGYTRAAVETDGGTVAWMYYMPPPVDRRMRQYPKVGPSWTERAR